MRTASSLALLAILGAGCHTMIGHDPPRDSAPAAREARVEASTAPDLPRSEPKGPQLDLALRDTPTMHDYAPSDVPIDLPVVFPGDQRQPDTLKPDTLPPFSQTSCKNLWLDSPVIQLSAGGGGRPAIVTFDGDFYVVYGEGGKIQLHRLTPTANLGRTPIGSSNSAAPTVAVTRGTGTQLGVAWENAISAAGSSCPSNLLFTSFDVPMLASTTPPAPTPLTSTSCTTLGYSNPSLVHNGTLFAVATPAQYACSNATHYKPLLHAFNPASIAQAPGCYTGTPDTYATVLHRITSTRYASAHLFRASPSTPFMITLFRNNGTTSWATWEGITAGILPVGQSLPGSSLTEHRPALASLSDSTGDTVHLAWMASDEKLRTHSCSWATNSAAPTLCLGSGTTYAPTNVVQAGRKYAHPALAASSTHANTLLLAYALDSKAIGITKLAEGVGVAVSPFEHQVTRTVVPRYTALAAHPEGFGLVWAEQLNGKDEVFFKWIGCLGP